MNPSLVISKVKCNYRLASKSRNTIEMDFIFMEIFGQIIHKYNKALEHVCQ